MFICLSVCVWKDGRERGEKTKDEGGERRGEEGEKEWKEGREIRKDNKRWC